MSAESGPPHGPSKLEHFTTLMLILGLATLILLLMPIFWLWKVFKKHE